MENKELETWLEETKAKNLSEFDLYCYMDSINLPIPIYNELRIKINADSVKEATKILFNQWQKELEFSPKRGDRVLVWNNNIEESVERYFLTEIKGSKYPIIVVCGSSENEFTNNKTFDMTQYKHMKPLPTEHPTETDFKSKVIKLIRDRIVISNNNLYDAVQNKLYDDAAIFQKDSKKLVELLNEIINLC